MMMAEEWTSAELARLQSLDAEGVSVSGIAASMGRSAAAIRDQLPIVRARQGAVPIPVKPGAGGLEWNGPDEEGDVPPPTGRSDDDPAAWVHSDPQRDP